MSETNKDNLEKRFEAGELVLDYFDTDVILTIDRLAKLAPILNVSAIAREARINVQTLQAKIRRRTPSRKESTHNFLCSQAVGRPFESGWARYRLSTPSRPGRARRNMRR